MHETALVIPCFNEAERLPVPELLRLVEARPGLTLVLVDDGSTDGTAEVLASLRRRNERQIVIRSLEVNSGKAEAVRQGLRFALGAGARTVGYCDADLSTPVDEVLRLLRELDATSASVVLGSRVRLLGRRIERRASRHYLGRVFATLASLALALPVYDTQCGAKVFRATAALRAALARPFRSRWIFDVELIGRLLAPGAGVPALTPDDFCEVPLLAWRDVPGSKLRPRAMLRAGCELLALVVRRRLAPGRKGVDAGPPAAEPVTPLAIPAPDRHPPDAAADRTASGSGAR